MPNQSALSSSSQYATDKSNDPDKDIPTASIVWEVPDDEYWELPNRESAVMTAKTADDNTGPAGANADPSPGTNFGLAYRESDAVMNQWTVFAVFGVDAFNALSQVEQLDDKGESERTVEFDTRVIADENGNPVESITLSPGDQFALVTNGDDGIDGKETYFRYARTVYSA